MGALSFLLMVILLVDGTHDFEDRKPPLVVFLVPYGAHLMVFIESDRYFVHIILKSHIHRLWVRCVLRGFSLLDVGWRVG